MKADVDTSTAQWSLVVHRVSRHSVEVWVGTLFPTLNKPECARVRLIEDNRKIEERVISKRRWRRPFTGMRQRFFHVVTFRGLTAGSEYRLAFDRLGSGVKPRWRLLCAGTFRTLPSRVPEKGRDGFTIALGSCFYNDLDNGRAAASYKALYERGSKTIRPDVTVLAGDQVYLDIGFESKSLSKEEIREHIADGYACHWQALGSMLSRGGTWMLPDDHEYWNDYPFTDSLLHIMLGLKLPDVHNTWRKAAYDGVRNVQRSPVVESFTLGDDLSVCLADLRSHRSEHKFLPEASFKKLLEWARRRACPGVLVIPQPLIVEQNPFERNLRSYGTQYARLLEALGSVPHDVVVLSGDVHFGRIASVPIRKIGKKGARLIEIISSPMSNLTGIIYGLAASVATDRPDRFPHLTAAKILKWPRRRVNYYERRFFVKSQKGGWLWSDYPWDRTREHVMTVSFCRRAGGIEVTANAWLLRQRTRVGNMPVRSFTRPFRTILK